MKKIFKRFASVFLAFSVVFSSAVYFNVSSNAEDYIPIYRAYNPMTGEHLFTADINEVKRISKNHGWRDEGLAWNSPKSGTPVYRLYLQGAFHLYTSDTEEIKQITTNEGWVLEANGKPVCYSGGDTPIYRLFNPVSGHHLYTTDENEYKVLPTRGWNAEGIAMASQGVQKPVTPVPVEPTPGVNNPNYVKGVWF